MRRFADIQPGPRGSNPFGYAAITDLPAGPRLFFSGWDRANGQEPRVLPLGTTGAAAMVPVRPPCARAVTPPTLARAGGDPRTGNAAFRIDLRASHPNTVAALLVDFGFGGLIQGCQTMLPAILALPLRTNAAGLATLPAAVPMDPRPIGQRLFVQGGVATAGGFVFGVVDLTSTHALIVGG